MLAEAPILELQRALFAAREERDLCQALVLADGATLRHFRREVAGASERIPALLRQHAREAEAFRHKLQRLDDELARLADLLADLPVPPLESQMAATRASLQALMAAREPDGDALLPVIAQTDALLNTLRLVCPSQARTPFVDEVAAEAAAEAPDPGPGRFETALVQLATQLAVTHRRELRVHARGLELLPSAWESALFDVASQLLRNAAEHGIEPPERRVAAGKPRAGTIEIEFVSRPNGCEFSFRDDGEGLDAERILDAGARLGLVDGDPSKRDVRRAATLIFKPGLSTAAEPEGRGNGMQIVRDQIRRLGGSIRIAAKKGRYTSLRADLPVAGTPAPAPPAP